ncbi:DUF5710 domain-containing protein [Pseudomonas sp. NA-150]|uniref:DUF5710 domain-containing protein n=1 Tax=Pseudomonas sp. NA-150 TaxID=3367525 RepID=UPI0037CB2B5A
MMTGNTYGEGIESIYLAVPFSEKDEAKSFTARRHPVLKTWYVPVSIEIPEWLTE